MAQSVLDFPVPVLGADAVQRIELAVAQYTTPLLLLDCERVRQQYQALQAALPNVQLYFALKPLPHRAVVRTLLEQGACFDLASRGEIDLVRGEGVPAAKTIFTHPIKRDQDIRDALAYGCTTFVIDNEHELLKFMAYRQEVELLVRLSFRNEQAFADLSKKFGCMPDNAIALIQHAHDLGIRIKGLSFHVGSQTIDPAQYVRAITTCQALMDEVVQRQLPALKVLDIGGGFPVHYRQAIPSIEAFCQPIEQALAQLPDTVDVIAEPGRFIVASAVTGVSSVVGQAIRDNEHWYYLDDGVYGSFSGLIFDHGDYPLFTLKSTESTYMSVLAGPTCDSIDVIAEHIQLPFLEQGDLVITTMLGAYASASATDFNFIERAQTLVYNELADEQRLLG